MDDDAAHAAPLSGRPLPPAGKAGERGKKLIALRDWRNLHLVYIGGMLPDARSNIYLCAVSFGFRSRSAHFGELINGQQTTGAFVCFGRVFGVERMWVCCCCIHILGVERREALYRDVDCCMTGQFVFSPIECETLRRYTTDSRLLCRTWPYAAFSARLKCLEYALCFLNKKSRALLRNSTGCIQVKSHRNARISVYS